MEWITVGKIWALPQQGRKILWWDKGDCWVAQRFGNYWFPIPFTDSQFARTDPPEKWAYVDCPDGYSGLMRIEKNGQLIDFDQLEEFYPEDFKIFLDHLKKISSKKKKGKT